MLHIYTVNFLYLQNIVTAFLSKLEKNGYVRALIKVDPDNYSSLIAMNKVTY